MASKTGRFRLGTTPGSFQGMGTVVLRDVKGLSGKKVKVTAARKKTGWAVIPEGAESASAVEGEKLLVDTGMGMPVRLVDVEVTPPAGSGYTGKAAAAVPGRADAFRAERSAWSVILPGSKPGSASLIPPGQIQEKGGEPWVAPVRLKKVEQNGKEQFGVFAARSFSSGDCITVEAPLMVVQDTTDIDTEMGGMLVNKGHKMAVESFLKLPTELKQVVLQLFAGERLLVTMSNGEKRWQEPVDRELFFEQLGKRGVEVGSCEEDKAVIWHFIRLWDSNCMATSNGTALFALSCRVNHSCKPNACRVLLPGNQIALVASTKIEEGDEIVASYLLEDDLLKCRARRQQVLSQWDFQCGCSRCLEPEAPIQNSLSEEQEASIEAACAAVQGSRLDISEARADLLKLAPPEGHWLRLQVDGALRDLEELEGNYAEAQRHQLAVLRHWEDHFPGGEVSIRRAQHRGGLGDLERRLGQYMAAFELYSEGLAEVSSFQFPGFTACQELKDKLQSLLACDKGVVKDKQPST